VQLHGAHGYFLSQWLSPYHNRREDEYGGIIENRARISLETYDEVRRRCGNDFLVMIKLNSQDFVPDGATFDDCRFVCRELARRGIDAIEISGGVLASDADLRWARPRLSAHNDEAYFATSAAQIAEEIEVPVILVGGLKSIEVLERLLAETRIGYFSLSRPLMTEPNLVQRWQQGDRSKAKCISCNQCRDPMGNICIFRRQG
jgi:2,4-dienoyl-CoA reductase-like NADH-dependent reductase (Old Yellow Enzyme family)